MYYTIYKSGNLWYWNLKAANHQIVANGEGYYNQSDAMHAIALVKGSASAPVYQA
jgi:uncharacterized protein YegP (UPF0339 family)